MASATMTGRRVLLVDDDPAVRNVLRRHLGTRGYDVAVAADATEALAEAQRGGYDVVLADVHMPGLSGLELTEYLLAYAPLEPVLLMTGDREALATRAARTRGAAGYLLKPFGFSDLDDALAAALKRRDVLERARSRAATGRPAGVDPVPGSWMEEADSASGAGSGHGLRVARVARWLAQATWPEAAASERSALGLAARAHELGRLLGPADTGLDVGWRTAHLLTALGVAGPVMRAALHAWERWDGTGGPDGLAGADIPCSARALAITDALDHEVAARRGRGAGAVSGAIDALHEEHAGAFDPELLALLDRQREAVGALVSHGAI